MSSTLWAHLLNKDTTVSGPGLKTGLAAVEPAMSAPADRAGTSVRILLHDTQATIEKFSERVDNLVSEAENSRQKLLARNEEVNEEVERLVRRVIQEQGVFLLLTTIPETLLLPNLGFPSYFFRTRAHILTLVICHRQWAERKQRYNHASGNQPKLPPWQNYGSPFQALWML